MTVIASFSPTAVCIGDSMKKFRVYSLSFIIALTSILAPGRAYALAFGNVQSLGTIAGLSGTGIVTRGASLVLGPWGALAGLAVGSYLSGFYLTGSNGDTVNVLPAGVATTVMTSNASNVAGVDPVTLYGHADLGWFSSLSAACTAGCTFQHLWASPTSQCTGYTSGNCYGTLANGQTNAQYWAAEQKQGCIDPLMSVYPDGKCHFTATSGSQPGQLPQTEGYKYPVMVGAQPLLQDMPTAAAKPLTQDKPIRVSTNPQQTVEIRPMSDGGIQTTRRTFDPATQTTTIETVRTDSTGKVISNATSEAGGDVTGSSSSGFSIDLPTDYNREPTQQQAVQKLDDIKTGAGAMDEPNYDVDGKTTAKTKVITDKLDALPSQYAGDKGNWFSWVWTPPVGQCQPWTSVVHGRTVSWNVCPYVDKIRDVIGYLLAVSTAVVVYGQLFRRED